VSSSGQTILDFNTTTLSESKRLFYWMDLFSCSSGVIRPQISYISCCKGCIACW
jgi:hypothetical protein